MSYSPTGLANYVAYRRGQESVTVPIWKQVAGEFPTPNYAILRDIYLSDPDMYSAVNFVANRALSHGFHIECNSNVPGHEEAEEFLTDWLDYVRWGDKRNERGYEPLLRIMTRELAHSGTTILEMINGPDDLQAFAQLQLSSIWKFQRDDVGNLTAIWQQMSVNPRALTPSKYVIFSWNLVDREPAGKGLIHPMALAKPNMISGGLIPPMISIKWQMEDDARRRLHVQASPHTIFSLKGLPNLEAKEMAEAIRGAAADERFVTNTEVGVASDATQTRANFGPEFDMIDGRIKSATGNILTEMLTGKGFSYASAVKAGSLADEIVWDMQYVIKSGTENWILQPVLEQNGFDARLLKPKFVFNIPDNPQEWTIADLITALQNGAITKADFVRNAKQFGKWDLDDPVELGPSPSAPMQPNIPNPGNLPTNISPQLDPVALQNLMQVQSNFEKAKLEYQRALEQIAAGSAGAASGVSSPQRKRKPDGNKA